MFFIDGFCIVLNFIEIIFFSLSFAHLRSVHRQLGPRQRSMPVQIDTEFLRLIPKHLRKRIKSAGSIKKKI